MQAACGGDQEGNEAEARCGAKSSLLEKFTDGWSKKIFLPVPKQVEAMRPDASLQPVVTWAACAR